MRYDLPYDTIRNGVFTWAQKLTKSQLNIRHGTKRGEIKEKASNISESAEISDRVELEWSQRTQKLAPYGNDGRLLLTAKFEVTWHKNYDKNKKSGPAKL